MKSQEPGKVDKINFHRIFSEFQIKKKISMTIFFVLVFTRCHTI